MGTAPLANLPGLPELLTYRRADLSSDLIAGLSVAAVALPVGVAYAQLAGFRPEAGLYASILPLVAYALFRNLSTVDRWAGRGHLRAGGRGCRATGGR